MAHPELSEEEFSALTNIFDLLEQTELPTQSERAEREENLASKINNGQFGDGNTTWGEAVGVHPIFNLPQKEFSGQLKSTRGDLTFNCEVLIKAIENYFEFDEPAPPAFAERIAIILRKRKTSDLEVRFLIAWNKHFGVDVGFGPPPVGYLKLVKRLEKIQSKARN